MIPSFMGRDKGLMHLALSREFKSSINPCVKPRDSPCSAACISPFRSSSYLQHSGNGKRTTRPSHMRKWISLLESENSMRRSKPSWRLGDCSVHDLSGNKYGMPCNEACRTKLHKPLYLNCRQPASAQVAGVISP